MDFVSWVWVSFLIVSGFLLFTVLQRIADALEACSDALEGIENALNAPDPQAIDKTQAGFRSYFERSVGVDDPEFDEIAARQSRSPLDPPADFEL